MMITSEIHQVGGSGLTAAEDAAVYLVLVGQEAAIVDAGCGRAHAGLLKNIGRVMGDTPLIRYLLLTHCHYDHAGGAAALKRHFGLKIVAHEKDAVFLETGDRTVTGASWYGADLEPLAIDRPLRRPAEIVHLGNRPITALHVPGHSPGSTVYWVESDGRKVLFAQDVHGPIHPDLRSDAAAYQSSLKRMLALDADILCEGHFGVFHGKQRVRDFIRTYVD